MDLLTDTDDEGSRRQPFTILTGDRVLSALQRIVSDTCAVSGCWTPITCRLLLDHFRWDAARLLDQFFYCGGTDSADFYAAANVAADPKIDIVTTIIDIKLVCQQQQQQLQNGSSCSICCDENISAALLLDLAGCGHRYCRACWTQYVQARIRDVISAGTASSAIRCPAEKCARPLPDERISDLLLCPFGEDDDDGRDAAKNLLRLYQRAICQPFVRHTAALAWCPAATGDCGRAVLLHAVHAIETTVSCACGTRYCFNCAQTAHDPLPCFLMQRWSENARLALWLDGASADWMRRCAKQCPECRMPIEKTDGCDHMQCGECGAKFNWSEVAHGTVQMPVSVRLAAARQRFERFDRSLNFTHCEQSDQWQTVAKSCWQTLRNVTVLLFFVRDYETELLQAFYQSLEEKVAELLDQKMMDDQHRNRNCAVAIRVQRELVGLIRAGIGNWNFTD